MNSTNLSVGGSFEGLCGVIGLRCLLEAILSLFSHGQVRLASFHLYAAHIANHRNDNLEKTWQHPVRRNSFDGAT